LWFTLALSNQIGRMDPETLEVTEFETPYPAPRRLRFAKDGTLWIPSFESGVLMKFDTATESFEAYPSPTRVTFLRDFIFTPDGDVCTSNANLPAGAIEGGRAKFMCLTPARN